VALNPASSSVGFVVSRMTPRSTVSILWKFGLFQRKAEANDVYGNWNAPRKVNVYAYK
jgi:hypothetical protein